MIFPAFSNVIRTQSNNNHKVQKLQKRSKTESKLTRQELILTIESKKAHEYTLKSSYKWIQDSGWDRSNESTIQITAPN